MSQSQEPDCNATEAYGASPRVRAGDFLWHPLRVKILWFCSFSYWSGVVAAEVKPDFLSFFHTIVGGYIAIFLCPPFVFLMLVGLFLRAWFARLDMSDWGNDPDPEAEFYHELHWSRVRYREFGGPFDPTLDPTDPRSGILHLRHIGVIKH